MVSFYYDGKPNKIIYLGLVLGYLLSIFAVAVFIIAFISVTSFLIGKPEVNEATNEEKPIPKIYLFIIFAIALMACVAFIGIAWYTQGIVFAAMGLVFIVLFLLIAGASDALYKLFSKESDNDEIIAFNKKLNRLINISSILFQFVLFNTYASLIQAYLMKYETQYQDVTIEYEGKKVSTTPTYMYIGRVKNFTFFFDKQTGYAHVYPNSGIKRIYMR